MGYVITSACIGSKDRSCVEVCPVDCIYDADRMMLIHPDECIDCGACESECPVQAIYPRDRVPDAEQPFIAANEAIAMNDDAAAEIDRALEAARGRAA